MATPIGLIYLDVDDEITSAANRIRNVTEMRVALVLPAGSRLATSRINFRLLAREAQSHAHDLYIVAPEAATRSLAASAGLAVYTTVRELEDAMADADELGAGGGTGGAAAGASAVSMPLDVVAPDRKPPPHRGDMARPLGERSPPPDERPTGYPGMDRDRAERGRASLSGRSAGADLPVVSGARRRAGPRRGWIAVVAALVVVLVVGVFAAAQFLPAATIVVTPKVEPISLTFNVTADPTVTSADLAAGIVPATQPEIPLEATDDFSATGRKVTETKATGTVTFSNLDPTSSNTIAAGSIVETRSNRQFVTKDSLFLPRATLVGLTIVPSTGDIAVTAAKPGTAGNVAAGAINVVPNGENSTFLKVTNNAATSGGTHTEKVVVSQKDIDGALAALSNQIDLEFAQIMTEPSQILPDVTIFPDTKSRTAAVPSPDPKTLLGDQVDSFSLSMTATGTVTAVDESAVSTLATARLRAAITAGRDLVKDSLNVTVGQGTAQGADIVFPVQATAQQVRRVVASDLVDAIRGKSLADARSTLETYGTTTIDLWPGFASSIPTYDFRIDLTVKSDIVVETGSPAPGSSTTPRPSATRPAAPASSGSTNQSSSSPSPKASPKPTKATSSPAP